jgi:hypothetical protein
MYCHPFFNADLRSDVEKVANKIPKNMSDRFGMPQGCLDYLALLHNHICNEEARWTSPCGSSDGRRENIRERLVESGSQGSENAHLGLPSQVMREGGNRTWKPIHNEPEKCEVQSLEEKRFSTRAPGFTAINSTRVTITSEVMRATLACEAMNTV